MNFVNEGKKNKALRVLKYAMPERKCLKYLEGNENTGE